VECAPDGVNSAESGTSFEPGIALVGSAPELREPLWGLVKERVHQLHEGLAVATEEPVKRAHRDGVHRPDVDICVPGRSGRLVSVRGMWPRLGP
jgi:hypothetical protein